MDINSIPSCVVCLEGAGAAGGAGALYGHLCVSSKKYIEILEKDRILKYERYVAGQNVLVDLVHIHCLNQWANSHANVDKFKCMTCRQPILLAREMIELSLGESSLASLVLHMHPEIVSARKRACVCVSKKAAFCVKAIFFVIYLVVSFVFQERYSFYCSQLKNRIKIDGHTVCNLALTGITLFVTEELCAGLMGILLVIGMKSVPPIVERNVFVICDRVSSCLMGSEN